MNNGINQIKTPSYLPELKKAALPQDNESSVSSADSVSLGMGETSAVSANGLKKWTVLHYGAADNDISGIIDNALELESIGSDKDINIVAQLDVGKKAHKGYEMDPGCKRYYFCSAGESTAAPLELGQVNMANPEVLADFVKWGIKNYPAENYMLIMSSHGKGWAGMVDDRSHKGWMSAPEIRNALESVKNSTGEKMDVLGFDACCMASVEVAAELSGVADYMVASQNTIGQSGWPYSKIFSGDGRSDGDSRGFDIAPKDAAKRIVEKSTPFRSIQTLSALELAKVGSLTGSTADFTKELMSGADDRQLIKKIASESKAFYTKGRYHFIDQYDFALRISKSSEIKNEKLRDAACEMMKAIKSLVVSEYHKEGFEEAGGISIESSSNGLGTSGYQDLLFAKETHWNEANADTGIKKLWNSFKNFLDA